MNRFFCNLIRMKSKIKCRATATRDQAALIDRLEQSLKKNRHTAMVGTRFRKTELTNSNRTFWDFSEPSAFCHEISDKSNNVSKTAIQLFPGKRKLYIDTIVEEVKRKKNRTLWKNCEFRKYWTVLQILDFEAIKFPEQVKMITIWLCHSLRQSKCYQREPW